MCAPHPSLFAGLVLIPYQVLVQITMMMLTPVFVVFILAYIRCHHRTTGKSQGRKVAR